MARNPASHLGIVALLIGTALALGFLIQGCSDGSGGTTPTPSPDTPPDSPSDTPPDAPAGEARIPSGEELLERYDVEIPEVTYVWDPDAGDPDVPAELGGPGFTGEGWETNLTFPALGVPEAKKGGRITMHFHDWPKTMRFAGQGWNTSFNYRAEDLCVETLLYLHQSTLELTPKLATHWKISEDKSTYTYRLNPAARWSDGQEITSEDVIASWRLRVDDDVLFPSAQRTYGKLEEPVAISKYIVEVRAKEESWRNFIYFSSALKILPAHQISIPGGEYLEKFNFRYHAVSGPYTVLDENVEEGESITLTRRPDWWDRDNPAWTGLFNFDEVRVEIVRDQGLAFEKAKKGELDIFWVMRSQWWAEEVPRIPGVQRGLIQPRKIFNGCPVGISGIACNTRRPPLDDVRLRKAIAHLFDRETMLEKLMFDEYAASASYWPSSIYSNPNNVAVPYDELEAVRLLEEAGWTEIGSDGIRVRDDQRLKLTLIYRFEVEERHLTILVEACEKAGIEIELQRISNSTHWENIQGKSFDLAAAAWGAIPFPNPETSYGGHLAEVPNNNNITGFSSPRVDELLGEYDREYDVARREAIIREIDGIVFEAHPYVLDWHLDNQRVIYRNRFGMPKWVCPRIKRHDELFYAWWVDPEKEAALAAAEADDSIVVPTDPHHDYFWKAWEYERTRDR